MHGCIELDGGHFEAVNIKCKETNAIILKTRGQINY